MAADETFSSVQALQDAIAKDVEQRIATAHMRPPPSKPAAARGASILNNAPGTILAKTIDTVPNSKHAEYLLFGDVLYLSLGLITLNLHVTWQFGPSKPGVSLELLS